MEENEQIYSDEELSSTSEMENQTHVEITDDSLEKANFSKHTYNLIKRARRKGKLHGIKLPYLQYNLTKGHPRPIVMGIAIFSAIVMLLSFAGAIYTFIAAAWPLIQFSSDATEAAANIKIPIADLFGGVGVAILWMIVVLLLVVIITVVVLLVNNTLKLLNFSRSSVEEFAYSHEVRDLLSNFATTIILALLIGIGTLFANSKLGLIFGILLIVIGILFIICAILLIIERSKARKELSNTNPTKLEFIKNYFASIRKICKHKSHTQTFFEFSKWR